jgi:molybdate-binding protein
MSVDAEGHDLVVLKSNNWDKYRPAIVMVESNNEFIAIRSFMDGIDYLHIFSNHYNAIFIDKRTVNQSLLKNVKWKRR